MYTGRHAYITYIHKCIYECMYVCMCTAKYCVHTYVWVWNYVCVDGMLIVCMYDGMYANK